MNGNGTHMRPSGRSRPRSRLRAFGGASLVLTVVASLTLIIAPAASARSTTGLVGWWEAEGDASDSAGSNDATLLNGAGFGPGQVGQAFTFDGTDDYGLIPDSPSLKPPQLTVELWFRPDTNLTAASEMTPFVTTLAEGQDACCNVRGYDVWYTFGLIAFGLPRADGLRIIVAEATEFTAGEWHHVAGTYDGSSQKLYLDGVLVDSGGLGAAGIAYGPAPIQLARADHSGIAGGFTHRFDGSIDELAVYDRALSEQEIEELVNGGPTEIVFTSTRDGDQEIYGMAADGSGQTNLTNNPGSGACPNPPAFNCSWDYHPAISADGARVVFGSTRDTGGNGELYSMNADGTDVTRLTNDVVLDNEPSISPDGTKIAWSRGAPAGDVFSTEIWVMNADGTGATQLTSNPGADGTPSWSPDGSKIAFYSQKLGYDAIFVMNADGTGEIALTSDLVQASHGPDWTPDGSAIYFESSPFSGGSYEIWRMNADGSGKVPLTSNAAGDLQPTVSSDGAQVAFSSNRDGDYEIYVMNADGSGQVALTSGTGEGVAPDWAAGASGPPDTDADDDGVDDAVDNCPVVANADQADLDGDNIGDVCDDDRDGDGVANANDAFPDDPSETADSDGDGIGDNADAFPNDPDESSDADADGVGDNTDNCPSVENADQADLDGDDIGDVCDDDRDGDGVANGDDAFPDDGTESRDSDGDGTGDNADTDDDNDGQSDADETACGSDPRDAESKAADLDGDGRPDCVDPDDDNDGVNDGADNCPATPNPGQRDSDHDGLGDACDTGTDLGMMTGGGTIAHLGGKVKHAFTLRCDAAAKPQQLQVEWGKNTFHLEALISAFCGDDPSITPGQSNAGFDTYGGSGTGRLNGASGATAEWEVSDGGKGANDALRIEIRDAGGAVVLAATGLLLGGNHQAHAG